MALRHFLTLQDLSKQEIQQLLQRAIELKKAHKNGTAKQPFSGKVLAMIFEKSSTRTRVSFEAGMAQLGGSALFLSPNDTQLGRGESVEDSARVISRMVDIIMIRTFGHNKIEKFAEYSSVPVINALTDDYHPCQLLADMQTYIEHRGSIQGKRVVWFGDGNNMCQSYMNAADMLDFELIITCPEGFEPCSNLLEKFSDRVSIERDPVAAVSGANLVVTDTWASMGQEEEKQLREKAFAGFQVNEDIMSLAAENALFMHCLPAYRGLEISETIMESKWSVVWNEAENRLHAQKALVEFLLNEMAHHKAQ